MRHIDTSKHFKGNFKVLAETRRTQAATMVIAPGDHEGGPDNKHRKSDQWVYVVSGEGKATVEKRRVTLRPGSLLLIEAAERHQIDNTGHEPLVTVTLYGPPAY